MVLLNGDVLVQGKQASLESVEVVTATVDLEDIRAYRSSISRGHQAAISEAKYERIQTAFELSPAESDLDTASQPTLPIKPRIHSVEEEIALYVQIGVASLPHPTVLLLT
jgi:NAD+ synthase (glutamine-hydrolysing)